MTTLDTARVIHALTSQVEEDLPDYESWPEIARHLLVLGCDWPAAVDLAQMTTMSQPAILDAVARLAEQTGRELGDLPALQFWDTVCGLVARSWRLRLFDEVGAVYRMDSLWWLIRDLDESSQGLQMIWRGMRLKELHDHWDIRREAVALLVEADRLVPADAVDAGLGEELLDAIA